MKYQFFPKIENGFQLDKRASICMGNSETKRKKQSFVDRRRKKITRRIFQRKYF